MVRRAPRGRYLFVLSLAALGVVYGDIGTSPLYAMRECFMEPTRLLRHLQTYSVFSR
jgi:K+ transporter